MVGILGGYLASYLFIDQVGGWRTMYGLSLLPGIALALGMVRHGPSNPSMAICEGRSNAVWNVRQLQPWSLICRRGCQTRRGGSSCPASRGRWPSRLCAS